MSQLLISLISAMTIMGLFLLILIVGRLRPRSFAYAAPCLVGLTMIDLLTAHRAICLTAPQAELDAIPAAIEKIRSYHQAKYPDEFFRVHRTRLYEPIKFFRSSSADRVAEQVLWERMTAQPKYGVPLGIDYAKTEGTMNLYDIDFFFAPWVVRAPAALRASSTRPLDQVVYYPRVGYDLWNTRYFILPKQSILDDIERGSLTLLTNKRGEPLPLVASWPADEEDCLILENPDAMPRSWIVHEVEILSPIDHLRRVPRSERMERLLYRSLDAGLPLWEGTPFGDYPIDRRAMVESDDLDIVTQLDQLRPLSTNDPSSESIRIEDYQPDRVEIAAELTSNGLVVLADAFYPGWQATVDDKPAPILRTNRAMRGILVPAGKHRVIMYYQASYFWPGLVISAGSMLTSIILLVWGREANRE
jgi:hypothetical protein